MHSFDLQLPLGLCVQPAVKAVKVPAKKEETSSEESSDEDSEMEDAVRSLLPLIGIYVNCLLYF